jgi:hypothetical protein
VNGLPLADADHTAVVQAFVITKDMATFEVEVARTLLSPSASPVYTGYEEAVDAGACRSFVAPEFCRVRVRLLLGTVLPLFRWMPVWLEA